MKLFFDFLPIVLFFVTYKLYGIFAATGVIIVSTIMQVLFMWLRHRRVEKMHLITLALVLVLGGMTLYFQNEDFIKWKPTIVNWLFAIAFMGSHFIGKKLMIQRMLESQIEMPKQTWKVLNLMWISFFIVIGVINLFVAFNFDTDTWVDFKLFGMLGLTIVFVVLQGLYLSKHIQEPIDNEEKEQV